MMIYNTRDIWVGKSFDLYGEYSESEVDVFRQCIKPGSVVLDVGANVGSHTVAFARLVGPNGSVIAFEPERNAYYTLCGNIAINSLQNVRCHQQAIGNVVGTILVPELNTELTTNWGGLNLEGDCSQSPHYPIIINKIDEMNFTKVDFIKIDIEGMEIDALRGAEETIKKFKPILYVENDRAEKSEALIEYIKELGYSIHNHQAPMYNPNNYFEFKENHLVFPSESGDITVVSSNLFCYHQETMTVLESIS